MAKIKSQPVNSYIRLRSLRLIMRAYDTVTLSGEEEEKPDRQRKRKKESKNADV